MSKSKDYEKPAQSIRKVKLYGYLEWEKNQKRQRKIESLEDALDHLVNRLGIDNRIREQQAAIIWPDVVGDQIASVARADSINKGVLRVKVIDAVWRTELNYRKEHLKTLLNKALGQKVVLDIRFS